ncbi:MFS transporter [Sporosarcina sp. P12(2017)]|uniref:MFS transporter n=1 Tax=unclassified Sporosarcina TaxID=2647733 RepID=UPI000C172053|nr:MULTISPECIES: MFS transporter [unclassified Sporosarcina]PIC55983.1 MFS transporter [Sporosarcina sp. P10]PIC59593.1 MFS transporter [Sporosarcina sp. P12(2017)]
MNSNSLWTSNFLFISAANFFFIVTYFALLVTLPTVAITHYGSTSTVAGLFTTVYIGAAIIIRPLMGPWIETYGKQFMLIVSLILFTTASFLYVFFDSVPLLLIIRFIHGLGFGMATTITVAIVANIVPESRKGEGMGYFILSTNLGMVIGPFIGLTTLETFSLNLLFWVSAFCSLVAFLFALMTRLPKEDVVKRSVGEKRAALFEKSVLRISITGAFFGTAYASVLSFMAVFAVEQGLGLESSYFFVVYVVILLLTRPLTSRWYDQYGANTIIFPAIVSFAIGMLVLGLTTNAILFFIAAAFIGGGWGTLFPSFQTVVLENSEPKRHPVALATFLSVFDIGISGGSLLAGVLVGVISFSSLYIFYSIYIAVGLGVYYWAQKKESYV